MRPFFLLLLFSTILAPQAYADWTTLAPGLEWGTFPINKTRTISHAPINILRVDPKVWELVLTGKSWSNNQKNKTVKEWCKEHKLTAAINAGMFGTDYTTHVGYMGSNGHVNSSHINKYKSVAAFNPKKGKDLPQFKIFDLDTPEITIKAILKDFSSVVQNLRLIKRPGENRWSKQGRMWSEAALGEDQSGRPLFIFSRSPISMHDLNEELLAHDIGLVTAQHLEGGPEAQLYVQVGDITHEMFGSFAAPFPDNSSKLNNWPIPNIIGIRPKK